MRKYGDISKFMHTPFKINCLIPA